MHNRLLSLLSVLLALFALSGCGIFQSSADDHSWPVVASMNVYSSDGSQLMGTCRYDGRRFLVFGIAKGDAEIWAKANGFPLLGPHLIDEAGAYFSDSENDYSWRGTARSALPASARPLFRTSEVLSYNIPFLEDNPPGPGDVVPPTG
jgi:hypothetical protein